MRMKRNSFLYAASLLAASNVILQLLGFVYRIVLSRFGRAEGGGWGTRSLSSRVAAMS